VFRDTADLQYFFAMQCRKRKAEMGRGELASSKKLPYSGNGEDM
jgi:hypothetical protein